jgi:hypothetical protein
MVYAVGERLDREKPGLIMDIKNYLKCKYVV